MAVFVQYLEIAKCQMLDHRLAVSGEKFVKSELLIIKNNKSPYSNFRRIQSGTGRLTSLKNTCPSSNSSLYGIWGIFDLLVFKVHFAVILHLLKMVCNSKMTGHRMKWIEIWDSKVVLTCLWDIFDLLMFHVKTLGEIWVKFVTH